MKFIYLFLLTTLYLQSYEFDHKIQKDESGFWGEHYNMPKYSALAVLSIAAFEGSQSRLGETSYKSLEAGLLSQVVTEGLKKATDRTRPRNTDNPHDWGEGGESFPSGHVSGMTALVTPFILEYQKDYPIMHLLWALPLHQMGGRLKAQAHWQSDVIVGALVGFASGYYSHKRDYPLIVSLSKDNFFLGIKHAF